MCCGASSGLPPTLLRQRERARSEAERRFDPDQALGGASHAEQLRNQRFGIVEHDVVAAADPTRGEATNSYPDLAASHLPYPGPGPRIGHKGEGTGASGLLGRGWRVAR